MSDRQTQRLAEDLTARVRQLLQTLPAGAQVLCALSGGADSVAMTHCVMTQGRLLGLQVSAAHYNHRLRGPASDADEAFVRRLCADWGLPLTVGSGTVRPRGTGWEDAARRLRYAFLHQTAGAGWIATGHTLDDQAETVLLQLIRGTGLRGLGGMTPVRGQLLRPLLGVRRAAVLAYLTAHRLPHVDDGSNAGDDYRRNRVRHQILPLLAAENPRVVESLGELSERLRQDEALLAQWTQRALAQCRLPEDGTEEARSLSCAALAQQPPALRPRILRALAPEELALSARHTEALMALACGTRTTGSVALPGGWRAVRHYDRLTLRPARPALPDWPPVPLPVPGRCTVPDRRPGRQPGAKLCFVCEQCTCPGETSQNGYTFYLSHDTITGVLWVRPRQPGDTLRLPGGTRSLKRLMIDRKIPAEARGHWPVLADEAGVLAVPGLGVHQDRLVRPGAPALRITVVRQEPDGGTDNAI